MLKIVEEGPDRLEDYARVPIRFEVRSRFGAETLLEPYWKDYDEFEMERPTSLPLRFDVREWGFLAAYDDGLRVGGAIVACRCSKLRMLEDREDRAVLMDIRVHPEHRRRGIGRSLFLAATSWTARKGCREMIVETQDVNEPACRFYQAMGCSLLQWDPNGYGPEMDEARILWRLELRR